MAGSFVLGSISLTTARISPGGRNSRVSAPSRVFWRGRCRRSFAASYGCAPPVAPTPACMPPARSPMSTFPPTSCRTPIRVRHGRISPNFSRWSGGWAGCYPPTFGSARSSVRQPVSTHGSRRYDATTSIGFPPPTMVSSRIRPATSPPGHGCSTSTRWPRRHETCWG